MAPRHSRIEYGDNLRLQPQLSKIVDRAVVKFVNRHNGEPDLKGFDDPLFHLPKPTDPMFRECVPSVDGTAPTGGWCFVRMP